ncbi:LOW QUALITY PROTEIN: general transcription factor 3C polypeptide 3-like [Argopecten irradians]|uniref:LOW QUALITY PROTEIN: general transcription factor 3C polypeptide 3-like n=1 Tax=Argopecten irradians TaxID=31199 RepID=UPI003723ED8C
MAAEGNSESNEMFTVQPTVSSENPFDNVGKEITEENWMAWSETGGLVEVHYEEAEHNADEVSTNLDLLASLSMSEEVIPSTSHEEVSAASEVIPSVSHVMEVSTKSGSKTVELIVPPNTVMDESRPSLPQKLPPNNLVMMYLQGEINFNEFNEMITNLNEQDAEEIEKEDDNNSEDEDDDEMEVINEDDDPDYLPSTSSRPSQSKKRTDDAQSSDGSISPVKKRKYTKRSYTKRLIPKHLKGLMGEANLKFARGDIEEAIHICMDIIKEAPRAVLPYQTLAVIYETTGDMQKALEFHTLAAYLNPRDSEQWGRLAEMFLDQNQTSQAVVAYSQAIRSDPKNPTYIMERVKLYEELGETKKAMEGYRTLLGLIPAGDGDKYIELARDLSMQYFNLGEKQNAVNIMKGAFQIHPEKVTSEDVNLYLELLITEKKLMECVEVLVKHCGVTLIFTNKAVWEKNHIDTVDNDDLVSGRITIETCKIPELLPIDLGVKLSVFCLQVCKIPELLPIDLGVKLSGFVCKIPELLPIDLGGYTKTDLPVDDLWDLFVKVCDLLMDKKNYLELMEVTAIAMSCPFFMYDPRKLKQAEFMCLVACIMTKNGLMAFTFVREMCQKEGEKNQVWNLLNQLLTLSTENKYNKFCLRYLLTHPDHSAICLLNGHNANLSGTYKYALGEYVSVLRSRPKDPLVSLCIGLTFIHLAAQKFSAKKHFLLTQGLVFLHNYSELRGECQETNFNIGRALHQLGLTYAAIHYYQKVLDMKPILDDPDGILDLTYEAAYNLALIYQNSESHDLAAHIVNKYLVI